jgi:hypothetical protein
MSTHTEATETAAIQARMRELRAEMNNDVEALVNSTEDLADWRKYVRAQPWLCVGAAAFAGFLLAPARKRPQPATEAATKAGVVSGLGGALVGALATAIANRAALQLGEYVMSRINQPQPENQPDEPYRPD